MFLEQKKRDGNGNPCGNWYYDFTVNKKRIKRSTGTSNYDEALKIAEARRASALNVSAAREHLREVEERTGTKMLSIDEATIRAELIKAKKCDPSDNCINRPMASWRDFEMWLKGETPVKFVHELLTDDNDDADYCQDYQDLLELQGLYSDVCEAKRNNTKTRRIEMATYKRRIKDIRSVLKFTRKASGLTTNPFDSVDPIDLSAEAHKATDLQSLKRTTRKKSYTAEDCQLLFANPNTYCYPILMIGYYTGLRFGDILTLEWADVDMKKREIHRICRKTRKPCWPPIPQQLYDFLKMQQKATGKGKYVLDRDQYVDPYLEEKVTPKGTYYPGRQRIGIRWAKWVDSIVAHKLDENGKKLYHFNGEEVTTRTVKVEGSVMQLEPVMAPAIARVHKEDGKRGKAAKGIHALRHHYCYRMIMGHGLERPIPLTIVKEYVGHTTEEMTAMYCDDVDQRDMDYFRELLTG